MLARHSLAFPFVRSFRELFESARPWPHGSTEARAARVNAVPWDFTENGRRQTAHIGPYLAVTGKTTPLRAFEVVPKSHVVSWIKEHMRPIRGDSLSFEVIMRSADEALVLVEHGLTEGTRALAVINPWTLPRVAGSHHDGRACGDYGKTPPPSDPSKRPTRFITKKCKTCGVFTSTLVTPEEFLAAQRRPDWRVGDPKPTGLYFFQGSTCLACRGCGKTMYASPVRGIYNPKRTCNAKCMSSHGPVCECSCGGKNHGASFSAT
jgi:hypothetical protein